MLDRNQYCLKTHNTFGLDVSCKRFVEFYSEKEIQDYVAENADSDSFVIGEGSNLLFTKDYDGTILHSAISGITLVKEDEETAWIKVGSGENWDEFVEYCVGHGFYGTENLSLIPGEVGASAVQNIGAYGVEAKDLIDSVEVINLHTGKKKVLTNKLCNYAYRQSIFKRELKNQYIISYVVYKLNKTFQPNIKYAALKRECEARNIKKIEAQVLRNLIIEIRRKKLPDPCELGSAGSFFMNPVVSEDKYKSLLNLYPTMPHFFVEKGVKIPAGWLIEQCGWKGKALGHAGVYEKQALVLVNLGNATGLDIVNLSNAVRKDVLSKFKIDIIPEVIWI